MEAVKKRRSIINAKKDKPKPLTEIQLTDLQNKYLELRDTESWHQIFQIMVGYARSLVKQKLKNRVFLAEEKIHDYSVDAAIKVLGRYKSDETYKIFASFGGMLGWKVIEVMFNSNQKRIDSELSLNWKDEKEESKNELGDSVSSKDLTKKKSSNDEEFSELRLPNYVKKDVRHLLKEIADRLQEDVKEPRTVLKILAYTLLYLRRPKNKKNLSKFLMSRDLSSKESALIEAFIFDLEKKVRNYLYP